MNKKEFLAELRRKLSGLPTSEIEERISFYGEMIDDLIEEGISEAEAIEKIGPVEKLAEQILAEIPLIRLAGERIKPKRRLKVWEIVTLALGSPIWLSLAVAVIAVLICAYVALWSGAVSLWAVFGALAGSSIGGAIFGVISVFRSNVICAVVFLGAAFVCAGLTILSFYLCKIVTRAMIVLTKSMFLGIKKLIIKKGGEQ